MKFLGISNNLVKVQIDNIVVELDKVCVNLMLRSLNTTEEGYLSFSPITEGYKISVGCKMREEELIYAVVLWDTDTYAIVACSFLSQYEADCTRETLKSSMELLTYKVEIYNE